MFNIVHTYWDKITSTAPLHKRSDINSHIMGQARKIEFNFKDNLMSMSTLQHDSSNPTVDLYKQLTHYLLVISWGYFCAQHIINTFVRLKAAEIKN